MLTKREKLSCTEGRVGHDFQSVSHLFNNDSDKIISLYPYLMLNHSVQMDIMGHCVQSPAKLRIHGAEQKCSLCLKISSGY